MHTHNLNFNFCLPRRRILEKCGKSGSFFRAMQDSQVSVVPGTFLSWLLSVLTVVLINRLKGFHLLTQQVVEGKSEKKLWVLKTSTEGLLSSLSFLPTKIKSDLSISLPSENVQCQNQEENAAGTGHHVSEPPKGKDRYITITIYAISFEKAFMSIMSIFTLPTC